MDEPEIILKLIEEYPEFRPLYGEIYELCRNTEKVMEMFSKELQELDKNTVQYMIDELQNEINIQKKQLDEKDKEIDEKDQEIQALRDQIKLLEGK